MSLAYTLKRNADSTQPRGPPVFTEIISEFPFDVFRYWVCNNKIRRVRCMVRKCEDINRNTAHSSLYHKTNQAYL